MSFANGLKHHFFNNQSARGNSILSYIAVRYDWDTGATALIVRRWNEEFRRTWNEFGWNYPDGQLVIKAPLRHLSPRAWNIFKRELSNLYVWRWVGNDVVGRRKRCVTCLDGRPSVQGGSSFGEAILTKYGVLI